VESVKTVSELNMPAAGEVLDVNTSLADHPEAVNEDPYGKGWMVKIKLTGDSAGLLDAKAYEALVSAESH
jgi:glycine cleavage system H protein